MRNFLLTLALLASPLYAQTNLGTINGHTAWGDPANSNKLLCWISPQFPNNCWNQFLVSIVNYVNNWPKVPSGNSFYTACSGGACPYFYANYGMNTAANSWGMQPGDTAAECVQSGIAWKKYSGSGTLLTTCEGWFAYIQANGVSTGTDYPGIPYASSQPNVSGATYNGAEPSVSVTCPTGCNRIEPDKAANFALACLNDNEAGGALTGCVTLAKKVADMLHSVINGSPSSSVSPYPFRIDASSGTVYDQYNSDVVSEARLQDDLLANSTAYGLTGGQITNYGNDRSAALTWLKDATKGPIANGNWCENYYEDQSVGTCASNYINTPALDTADYEIDNPLIFPNWATDVPAIITQIFTTVGLGSTDATGANNVMAEQTGPYDCITVDATAHLALTDVKFGVAHNNAAYLDAGYRSFNWITYWLQSLTGGTAGQVVIGPTGAGVCTGQNTIVYFRVGYTDIIPEMLQAISLNPIWGIPPGGGIF